MTTRDYGVADLVSLLRKDQKPDLDAMICRDMDGYRFQVDLTDLERALTERRKL